MYSELDMNTEYDDDSPTGSNEQLHIYLMQMYQIRVL